MTHMQPELEAFVVDMANEHHYLASARALLARIEAKGASTEAPDLRGPDIGLETRLRAMIEHENVTRDQVRLLRRDFSEYILEQAEGDDHLAEK